MAKLVISYLPYKPDGGAFVSEGIRFIMLQPARVLYERFIVPNGHDAESFISKDHPMCTFANSCYRASLRNGGCRELQGLGGNSSIMSCPSHVHVRYSMVVYSTITLAQMLVFARLTASCPIAS